MTYDPKRQLGSECNCNQGRMPCTCGEYQRLEDYAKPIRALIYVTVILALGLLIWSV